MPVRRATQLDAVEIAACLAVLGYGTPVAIVGEKLALLTNSPADAVFVAGGPPGALLMGVASVHLLPPSHAAGHLARLTAVAVRPAAQGRGVGRALVGAAEAWAWRAGARRVEVTSGDHRPGAHAFYSASGFIADERRFLKRSPAVDMDAALALPAGAPAS